jgi:thioredoxin-related protein
MLPPTIPSSTNPMRTPFLTTLFAAFAAAAFAGGPDAVTDVNAALEKAKTENKMLFLQYGRENCGNCQVLKGYIKGNDVRLSNSKFVYADVNCDDSATSQAFRAKFKVEGTTLPFVVVASPDGTQLASRTGYGTARDYENLIRDAQKAMKKQ